MIEEQVRLASRQRSAGWDGRDLLDIRNLTVDYMTPRGPARAVDNVSLSIAPGEVFGLAGESGCGKSTVAHAVMRLIKAPGQISGGQMVFQGRDILSLNPHDLQKFRWSQISIVFQSAMNALNPVMTLGDQLCDAIRAHEPASKRQAMERAAELFDLVGISSSRLRSYPHELSGGMRQRSVIAMALALKPSLVIMDEPTTALDVVVQRDILQQIEDLQAKFGFSIMFITHDLSLLVEFSTRIAIMYAGRIVELAPSGELFSQPKHPYTVGLMNSFPSIRGEKKHLQGIPGTLPDLVAPPPGCRFAPRCPQVMGRCNTADPILREVSPGHWVACYLYPETEGINHASAI
ncbi:MAG: oligopeptide/dipeptide transporter, ATPase subunit [Chloroflexi bacterium]|nr:oligopeptide/dipeptide transporter, ATPase subunit [Chloroflexota bacterium]